VSQAATSATDLESNSVGIPQYFLWRRLHSLTGLIFGGYIVVHLFVNATLVQGTNPDAYQMQVDKIHAIPFLPVVEWVFIFLPIIYHTIYGIWITFTGRPNVGQYPFGKNYFYLLQRISAGVIVFFILFHVLAMKGLLGDQLAFVPDQATASTARHMNSSIFVAYVVYPIGIIASCFHLANGFWTAAITWGVTLSAAAQRRWGMICIGLFAFTLICGFLALGAAIHDGSMVVH
jgi:succinate dehydrogenase / fumarate reductase, cytochrome b subunit